MNQHQPLEDIHRVSQTKILLTLFLYFMIIISVMLIYDFNYDVNSLLFIFLFFLSITPIILMRDLMHPFSLFFIHSQFLFIYNMIDIHANKNFFRYGNLDPSLHDNAFFWSIIIIILWYIFMYLGYYFASKTKTSPLKNTFLFEIQNIKVIAYILIAIGGLSYAYLVYINGGFEGMIDGLTNRRETYSGLAYFTKLTTLITIGALILLSRGQIIKALIITIISFIFLATFGGRSTAFFSSIFPFIVFYHYNIKKFNLFKLLPLGLVMMVFAVALGNYRQYREFNLNFDSLRELLSDVASGVLSGEILPALVGSLMNSQIPYQFGNTLINIIYAPIPRSLWEGKPIIEETGIVGQALLGYDYWGLPPGPYGIAFYNFGFIGVVIVAFFVGIFVYKLYKKFVQENINKLAQIFYIMIIISIFDFISTSEQINLIFYTAVFLGIKVLDIIIKSFTGVFKKSKNGRFYKGNLYEKS